MVSRTVSMYLIGQAESDAVVKYRREWVQDVENQMYEDEAKYSAARRERININELLTTIAPVRVHPFTSVPIGCSATHIHYQRIANMGRVWDKADDELDLDRVSDAMKLEGIADLLLSYVDPAWFSFTPLPQVVHFTDNRDASGRVLIQSTPSSQFATSHTTERLQNLPGRFATKARIFHFCRVFEHLQARQKKYMVHVRRSMDRLVNAGVHFTPADLPVMSMSEQHAFGLINYLLPYLLGPPGQRIVLRFYARLNGGWQAHRVGGSHSNRRAVDLFLIKPMIRVHEFQFNIFPNTQLPYEFSPRYWQYKKYGRIEHNIAPRTEFMRFPLHMSASDDDDEPTLTSSDDDEELSEEIGSDDDEELVEEIGSDGVERIVID